MAMPNRKVAEKFQQTKCGCLFGPLGAVGAEKFLVALPAAGKNAIGSEWRCTLRR